MAEERKCFKCIYCQQIYDRLSREVLLQLLMTFKHSELMSKKHYDDDWMADIKKICRLTGNAEWAYYDESSANKTRYEDHPLYTKLDISYIEKLLG